MADKDEHDAPEEETKPNDKHNWGAADLEKVRQKIINIKKDDLEMIMNELELPKSVVERKLIEVNGDPIAAMKSFMGFDP
ncbi:unnamed protein product [Strongylus vulgaris]|uniref:Nascent polypeptide-associated complex subunit alpha-like UBA domain-containing protein n=1 Tax=Strongylus vulgaris TaxID=40348 RepID=A0A3P7JE46_STRVU|nr:unnamed protein product [Strongylus vulgaris]